MGVEIKGAPNSWPLEDSLEELAQLARTAGAEVVGSMTQRLPRPTYTYLGKGKLEELVSVKSDLAYDLVIADDELSPVQQQNLEEALKIKVLDRTALILDVFAKRAHTREGRLQVELAQHEYLLPRLAGQWSHLERLGGGIGTRGPGESQLETDRRLIRDRIRRLKHEIEEVRKHRALYREQRRRKGIPVVSLVGYTNAGKSTLFNALTDSHVFVEDKLFATLDPVTRRIKLPEGRETLLTDTVGFIQKLPTTVVAAFKATLEELSEADLLVHVLDITHRNAPEQNQAVEDILGELRLGEKPRITALNKIDLLGEIGAERPAKELLKAYADQVGIDEQSAVLVSAVKGWGLESLLGMIAQAIPSGKGEPYATQSAKTGA